MLPPRDGFIFGNASPVIGKHDEDITINRTANSSSKINWMRRRGCDGLSSCNLRHKDTSLSGSEYRTRVYTLYATRFQDAKEVFDRADSRRWGKAYDYYLRGWLPKDKGAPIVDLACERGKLLDFLKDRGYHCLQGVDISDYYQRAIAEMERRIPCAHYYLFSNRPLKNRDDRPRFSSYISADRTSGASLAPDCLLTPRRRSLRSSPGHHRGPVHRRYPVPSPRFLIRTRLYAAAVKLKCQATFSVPMYRVFRKTPTVFIHPKISSTRFRIF